MFIVLHFFILSVFSLLSVKCWRDDSHGLCKGTIDGFLIADQANAQDYFYCIDGYGTRHKCADNLVFFETIRTCDYKDEGLPTSARCPHDQVTYLPMEGHCDKYYLCFEGKSYQQECEAGLYFDQESQTCKPEEQVDCNPCPSENDPQNPVILSDKNDCQKYYTCSNGERISTVCEEGLHFNEALKYCTSPDTANCRYFDYAKDDTQEDEPAKETA